jgi:hypothetical protein
LQIGPIAACHCQQKFNVPDHCQKTIQASTENSALKTWAQFDVRELEAGCYQLTLEAVTCVCPNHVLMTA